jgi:hypothetical protein
VVEVLALYTIMVITAEVPLLLVPHVQAVVVVVIMATQEIVVDPEVVPVEMLAAVVQEPVEKEMMAMEEISVVPVEAALVVEEGLQPVVVALLGSMEMLTLAVVVEHFIIVLVSVVVMPQEDPVAAEPVLMH